MGEQVTSRLQLPLMAAGQAQKEVTHNEALLLIDSLTVPTSEAPPQNQPPSAPVAGQCWLVGAAPTGAWLGQAHALASWTSAGWRFAGLPLGAQVILAGTGARWHRIPTGWQAPPVVSAASGGAVIDSESRSAIAGIISALIVAGVISSS